MTTTSKQLTSEASWYRPDAYAADRVRDEMYALRNQFGSQMNNGDGMWFFQYMLWSTVDSIRCRCGTANNTSLTGAHRLPTIFQWIDLMDMLVVSDG